MRVWLLLALNLHCTENYYCIYHCLKLRNRWCIDMIVTISKKLNILYIFTYCTPVKTNCHWPSGYCNFILHHTMEKNNIYRLFSEQKQIIFRWLDEIVFFFFCCFLLNLHYILKKGASEVYKWYLFNKDRSKVNLVNLFIFIHIFRRGIYFLCTSQPFQYIFLLYKINWF